MIIKMEKYSLQSIDLLDIIPLGTDFDFSVCGFESRRLAI
jgi:hypothetical protein